jgi:uncharacterized phage protein (TIGR02218 family)
MKSASGSLISFLAAQQAASTPFAAIAELYTFTLQNGTVLRYTGADVDIAYAGNTYSSKGPLIDGLKYRATIGLNVDQQQITIAALPSVTVNGAPFMVALAAGAFDYCAIARDRAWYSDYVGGTLQGVVTLFKGRFLSVDECGRLEARVTVANSLAVLTQNMPRNFFAATCQHVLYDSGCGLNPASFATAATAGAGSTQGALNAAAALFTHIGGYVLFTSGLNAGLQATIKNANAGATLFLSYPLPEPVSAGDAFTIYLGCDHKEATCVHTFNNLANFKGFPFVPPPQTAQ